MLCLKSCMTLPRQRFTSRTSRRLPESPSTANIMCGSVPPRCGDVELPTWAPIGLVTHVCMSHAVLRLPLRYRLAKDRSSWGFWLLVVYLMQRMTNDVALGTWSWTSGCSMTDVWYSVSLSPSWSRLHVLFDLKSRVTWKIINQPATSKRYISTSSEAFLAMSSSKCSQKKGAEHVYSKIWQNRMWSLEAPIVGRTQDLRMIAAAAIPRSTTELPERDIKRATSLRA
jgi:hypothetical protein